MLFPLPKIRRLSIFLFLLVICFQIPMHIVAQSGNSFERDGVGHLQKGEYPQAIENFNTCIRLDPSDGLVYFYRGYAKFNLDDMSGAEQDFSRSVELSPYQADAFHYRGIVRTQLNDYDGAFTDYAQALSIDSSLTDVYINRARTHLILKKYYSCLMDCKKAISLKYKQEGVYILKGVAELGLYRYDDAIADLTKAISINLNNENSYIQRALVWVELNKTDSALIDLNNAIRLDSNNTYALFNRSLANSKIKDRKSALRDLDRVITLSPYNSYAYYNRAIIKIDNNDKKGAIRDFDYVSKLNPQNIVAYYYRSRLKADLKDYHGALEDLDKTLELSPEYADAWYERYEIKTKLKDPAGASEDFKKAMEMSKKNKLTPDSIKAKKEHYLQSLVKLSGDFEEMNTANSKFQNQAVEIELFPLYAIYLGKTDFSKVSLYDAYQKNGYYWNIIVLANRTDLMIDTVCRKEIAVLTDLLNKEPGKIIQRYQRAIFHSALHEYNPAFSDFDSTLLVDPGSVLASFSRAGLRFEVIKLIRTRMEEENQVAFGKKSIQLYDSVNEPSPALNFDAVLADLDKVIQGDPGFPFGYYNRGYVLCQMGKYQKAIEDFSGAIRCRQNFGEAYYNRGLLHILLGQNELGCKDMSRAGELGILNAYKVMKRYCYK